MASVQFNLSEVKLTSTWKCYQSGSNYVSTSPSLKDTTQTVQLSGIPTGATINSAVITYYVETAPNTGADLCTINGVAAGWRPGNHSVSLPVQSGSQFTLTFAFRAYGNSHQHVQSHSAVMTFRQIVLTVDYTEPYAPSDWSINTPSVDAGNPVSVTISPKGSGYTHHLRLDFGGNITESSLGEGVNVASVATSLSWLTAIPNTTSGVGNITLSTYYGGNLIGQSVKNVTITAPANVIPTLEAAVARVLTVGGVTYPDVTGGYVQQKSAVKADITSASGAYGSTIIGYSINIGGKSDAAFNSAGTSLTSPLLPDAGSIHITFGVTDSRGRTAQKILTIQVEGYSPPRASKFTVYRTDADGNADDNGTRGRYEFQTAYTSLGGKNSCAASIAAAGSEAQNISEQGWIIPGAVKELDVLLSYDVYLTLSDVYASVTVVETIPSINFAMHFSADGTSAWIGEACQHNNAFGVAPSRNVYFHGKEIFSVIPQKNLLDNSDFMHPVNQRGKTSYSGTYGIDRWRVWNTGVMALANDGLTVQNETLFQYFERGTLEDTPHTLAAMTTSGNLMITIMNPHNQFAFAENGMGIGIDNGVHVIGLPPGHTYAWADLYKGEYTAKTKPPHVPKGYSADLTECQKYFQAIPGQLLVFSSQAPNGWYYTNTIHFAQMRGLIEGLVPSAQMEYFSSEQSGVSDAFGVIQGQTFVTSNEASLIVRNGSFYFHTQHSDFAGRAMEILRVFLSLDL